MEIMEEISQIASQHIQQDRRHLSQTYQLGKLFDTHQEWDWLGNDDVVIHSNKNRDWREGTELKSMPANLCYAASKVTLISVRRTQQGTHRISNPGRVEGATTDQIAIVQQRLMGRVLPTTTGLTFADKEAAMVIATDSNRVKDGRGGAAYSIHTTATLGAINQLFQLKAPCGISLLTAQNYLQSLGLFSSCISS